MDEDFYESYCQWAEECLVWGRGAGNWCKAYTLQEWQKPSRFKCDLTEEELNNHPLCQFGL